ncbi:MAG: T9SS type A sorting domain-containing protein, partial [Saprospiraceae bacterium]
KAFAIVRYNQDGTVDSSFSTVNQDGIFLGPLGECFAIAIQSDGKIVAAGAVSNGGDDFQLARYNMDGTIDNSFGTNGVVTTDLGGENEIARSVVIQPDGKIIVAGHSNNGADYDFAIARYNLDGSLDNSFSINGMVTTDFENFTDRASSVILQTDGKIVVAGLTTNPIFYYPYIALARYNTDGTLDNSFGVNGKVISLLEGNAKDLVLQPDGKIIATGGTNCFVLLSFNADGTLDTDFGVDGIVNEDIGTVNKNLALGCTLQPDGRIVAVGFGELDGNNTDSDFAVARFINDLNLGVISFSRQENSMLIYPNPIKESATIEYTLTSTETLSLELYDLSGKLVQSLFTTEERDPGQHKETFVLDANLEVGNYILTLSNQMGSSSVRINYSAN